MEDRVKLIVMGISYTPLQSGAFALLLGEADGPYRIPLVIGAAEAQSIAVKLENIVTSRPITHDLFCSLLHAFAIELAEVFIYKFDSGIFYSEMTFTDGCKEVKLEARASDAIAVALRTGSPIFTTREIVNTTGAILKTEPVSIDDEESQIDEAAQDEYENMTDEELAQTLDTLIAEENYEAAAKISEIIKKRNIL